MSNTDTQKTQSSQNFILIEKFLTALLDLCP